MGAGEPGRPFATDAFAIHVAPAVIEMLREKALPSMVEHADRIEAQLERHGPGEGRVTLALNEDVSYSSYNIARSWPKSLMSGWRRLERSDLPRCLVHPER